MSPQTPNLNRRMWEQLESQVRSLAQAHGRIWIFTGSLFLGENGGPATPENQIGANHVAVPTHFYKVILCNHGNGNYEMFAFLMPNQREMLSGTPRDFIVSVDRIEQLTGLDFFSALPDELEEKLEKTVTTNWPVN
jgi:endonuclease G